MVAPRSGILINRPIARLLLGGIISAGQHPARSNRNHTMQTLSPAGIESRSLALLDSFSVLHFTAPNDRNGNPRRLWAVFTPAGQLVAAYDEGYEGSHAVPVAIRHKAATCYAIPVAASTYSAILRHARQLMA